MLTLALIVTIVLFLVIIAGLFYAPPAPYGMGLKFVAAICALLLFLAVLHVIPL